MDQWHFPRRRVEEAAVPVDVIDSEQVNEGGLAEVVTKTTKGQSPRSLIQQWGQWFAAGLSFLLILMVKLYQITLGPFLGGRCRFYPSCSYYFIEAVRKHGPVKGALRGLFRICRCHPFCEGGYDPP